MSASGQWIRFAQSVAMGRSPLAPEFKNIFGSTEEAEWDRFSKLFEGSETSLRWFIDDDQYIIGLCLMAAIRAEEELDIQRAYHADPDGDIEGYDGP